MKTNECVCGDGGGGDYQSVVAMFDTRLYTLGDD